MCAKIVLTFAAMLIEIGAPTTNSQAYSLSFKESPLRKVGSIEADTADVLAARVVEAAGWSLDEFTPEHVEKTFGVTLGPAESERGGGLAWKSTGSLRVFLSVRGPVFRYIVIDWGQSPNNPTKLHEPIICISNIDVSKRLLDLGWVIDHVSSPAPVDGIRSPTREVSEQYKSPSNKNSAIRYFGVRYTATIGVNNNYCVSQFLLMISPPPSYVRR